MEHYLFTARSITHAQQMSQALARAGVSPQDALMVGNDPDADMRGAAAAGMAGRYIHTRQSPPRGGPLPEGRVEIAELEELLKE